MNKTVKVELHVHTKYSYDSCTLLHEIIEACKKKKIDVLAIADHNEIRGAFRLQKIAPFQVIVGQEILTREGEIVGLFLKESISSGYSMDETIKRIKKQGGLSYLPHPFDMTTRKTSISSDFLGQIVEKVDIIEVYNGRTIFSSDNKKALSLAKDKNKLMGVGSDAHTKYELGRNYLLMQEFETPGQFLDSLRKAKLVKRPVMSWVFLITKWQRFKKKHQKLNLIDLGAQCDLCGETKGEVIYKKRGKGSLNYLITDNSYGEHQQIVKCFGCGLYYSAPRDSSKKLLERYQKFSDPLYEKERVERSANQAKIIKRLKSLGIHQGRLLDVGCATGGLIEKAIENNFQASGVELSGWAASIAQKMGLDVVNKPLSKAGFAKDSFDVVTCIDVVEHVDSPRKLVGDINKVLKSGGYFCIVTPNKNSLVSRILGEKWWHIRNDHIYYFSEETLSSLLEASGFEIVEIKSYGWSFSYDYWASRFQGNLNVIYRFLMLLKAIPIFNFVTDRTYTLNFGDSLEIYCRKA